MRSLVTIIGRLFGGAGARQQGKNDVNSSQEERAKRNLLRMRGLGVTEFKWMHSGVELPCNGEDHSMLDKKKYNIAAYLKSGKPLPGAVKGCRCTFSAVIEGFE